MTFMKKPNFFLCIVLFLFFFWPCIGVTADRDAKALQGKIDDAMRLFERGKVDAAIYKLQQVHKADPQNTDVLFKLGEMAISSKNWAYAINVLEKAAALKPNDIDVRLVLMEIYRAYQMPIQEIMAGREIVVIDPDNVTALRKLGYLYHDQSMPHEEEEVRRQLARTDPNDYENLNRLAMLQWKKDNLWEETLTQENIVGQFPEKTIHKKRLARIYGRDGDQLSKINQLEDVLSEDFSRDLYCEYAKTCRDYRHSLKLFDELKFDSLYQVADGDYDKETTVGGRLAYRKYFLNRNADLETSVRYKNINYKPEEDFLSGDTDIHSVSPVVSFRDRYRHGETELKAYAGFEYIDDSDTVNGIGVDVANIPGYQWLSEDLGGAVFVGGLELDNRFYQNFGFLLHFRSQLMEDLPAYARRMQNNNAGLDLYYFRSDGTRVSAFYEHGWIDGGNNRNRLGAEIFYPIFATNAIYDYKGNRVGYLRHPQDTRIDASYRIEYIDDDEENIYYENYYDEVRHLLTLYLSQKLRENLFFKFEGYGGIGTTLNYLVGGKTGIHYENPDTHNQIGFYVFSEFEKTSPKPQPGIRPFSGKTKTYGGMFTATWAF